MPPAAEGYDPKPPH